jgi:hypothetical protein
MRKSIHRSTPFLIGLLAFAISAEAQQKWTFELCGMEPYNLPLRLTIQQAGQPDINLTAHYSSRPFTTPFCWVWRIGHWTVNRSWELQAIHHKLYLDSKPREVGSFSISHGLNLITLNRGWSTSDYVLRVGGGIVLAHPESTIREQPFREDEGIFGMGYYVGGPAFLAGGGKQFRVAGGLFVTLEAMGALSYADIPVNDGSAQLYNIVFQLNFGLGYSAD